MPMFITKSWLPLMYDQLSFAERRHVRELYIDIQNGLCHYCHAPLDGEPSQEQMSKRLNRHMFPIDFFKYPVHLHHCHRTGMTVGAVHNRCNAILWQYRGE